MTVRVTRKDVAKLAGVSVTAVSRVMNNSGYVAKEKRTAILKAVETVGYRPSPVAVAMQKHSTKQLLFYNKDLSNAFTIETYRGMVSYASRHDYMVLLSGTWDIKKIKHMLIDGVILPNSSFIDEYIRIIGNKMFLPTISASYGEPTKRVKRIPLIESDTYAAMEMLIDYLFGKNHRKIALATPFNLDARCTAYRNKLLPILGKTLDNYVFSHGVDPPVLEHSEEDFFEYGQQLAKRIYESKCDATAVCCFNDNLAFGMIQQFSRLGVRVPEDISVTGIDGLSIGEYIYPKLTSVSISPFKQGSECVRVLIDLISGKKVKGLTRVPLDIVERESVKSL